MGSSSQRRHFSFDAASAISCGGRDYQEDAMVSDFSNGNDLGFVVLADGMGGHAAGDVASKIVVTEMFRELTFQRDKMIACETGICEALRLAADGANDSLGRYVKAHPETEGMGATLVSAIVTNGMLYWISIGDSPLFLFRDGMLTQLNEDHSMAQQIDLMMAKGMISAEDAKTHPDRNVLTSVLIGAPVSQVDCPGKPLSLQAGDTVIVASDGLQFLSDEAIGHVLRDLPLSRSKEIAEALMAQLMKLKDPDLDNVTLQVLQIGIGQQDAFVMASDDATHHKMAVANDVKSGGIFGAPAGLAAKGLGLFATKSSG